MSQKRKVLFVIESLACAGAEKSLTTLLNLLDYSKYEVDLQLFSYGGEFESLLPEEVNLLPALPYFSYCMKSMGKSIKSLFTSAERLFFKARMEYSLALRKNKYDNIQKSVLFWKKTRKCFSVEEKEYDIAIAYAQGVPTFYVADCVNAQKKYAWVNVTYSPKGEYFDYINQYYRRFDGIRCVSNVTWKQFTELFKEHREKTDVIYDINDEEFIIKMSRMQSTVCEDMNTDREWKILTVGRLANQKGYDIATDACKILKEKGLSFCWYALGKGPMESQIREWIKEKNIEDCFHLLGVRANPYPYFRACDLYVQTSKFEGFGLTLTEARMLNKPVVTTVFDTVYMQMEHKKNGLVVDLNAEAVADGIITMIEDRRLREEIITNVKSEKKGNLEELKKIEQLLGG